MAKNHRKQLLSELEDLAAKVGIKVRYERTDARGGMCVYKGSQLIIIDRNASDDYKISVITDNLKRIDLTDKYLSPKLRDFLENH